MSLTLLPQSGFSVMPWKNGGGSTAEVARHPEVEDCVDVRRVGV